MAINDVSLTSGMRSNLLSLQNTVTLLNRTQNRLSTGKKVNSAIDNPVSFFAAQSLTNRASTIDGLKDAMGQAVQTISAADKGITAITAMIEQAKGIAQSALSAAPGTTPTPVTGNATLTTDYSTVSLTLGAIDDDETVTLGTETFTVLTAGADTDAGEFGDAADLAAAINANTTLAAAGFTATEAGGVVTITNSGADIATTDIGGDATGLTTSEAQAHAENMAFTVGLNAYAGSGADAATAAADLKGNIEAGEAAGTAATVSDAGAVNVTFAATPSTELTSLQGQYNEMLNQIDTMALDSGYKGKNLLDADTLTVKFEGTHTLDVVGFDASSGGLGVTAATWTAGGNIDGDVTLLDAAMTTLSQNSSKLSGNLSIITVRQDFSTNMVNTLTEGSDKLTLADTNEEGANMLMLQTRQSLSTTALSMSAQAAQSVLRLFQ